MKVVQRTDLYVGVFVILVVGAVVAALVATSGWGTKRFTLFIRTVDAKDLRVDTKIYLQGLEVGRIAAINPRPAGRGDSLEFIIRAEMMAQFPDGTPLRLRKGTDAELEQGLLGGSTLLLDAHGTATETLRPTGDTIEMHRVTPALQQLGSLAGDLREKVGNALEATTQTLIAYRHLADSLTLATGTARRFVAGIQPGTERTLSEAASSLERMRYLLDSTNARSGLTLGQLNATMEQSRRLMASADSLTRLLAAMGAQNNPAIHDVLENTRILSQQTIYLMEALSRRPMRIMSGVDLPESLTAEGRARRARADSIARSQKAADSARSPRTP